jgi:hypothetical protein
MATEIRSATSSSFSDNEQSLIITDLLALKKAQIGDLLASVGLAKSGTKHDLRERIEGALEDRTLSLTQIVQFLDSVIPWGKQHVYLYNGPRTSIANWRSEGWVAQLLTKRHLGKYLNASIPLVLPDKMKLSSILHNPKRLRITAIRRRDWWERNPDYDGTTRTDDCEEVELRAYVHRVTRSLVAFDWDLVANNAFLQISQLPRGVVRSAASQRRSHWSRSMGNAMRVETMERSVQSAAAMDSCT